MGAPQSTAGPPKPPNRGKSQKTVPGLQSRGRSPQELPDRDFEKVAKKIIKTGPSLSCQEFYVLYESTGPISMIFGGFFGKKHLKI